MKDFNSNTEYWLQSDEQKVVDKLSDFHSNWWSWDTTPFKQMWIRNYIAYYSPLIYPQSWDSSLIFEGVQGELTRFYTPKSRTLIRQLTSIVTKQRLEFKASAQSEGAETLDQLKLANAVSAQVVKKQRLDNKGDQLAEGGLVCGNWFTKATWKTDAGDIYITQKDGTPISKGDVEIQILSPFNVFWNILLPWDEQPWVECRVKRNKWDLIAAFPDLRNEILQIPTVMDNRYPDTWFKENMIFDEDYIYVYEMYARPSPSLPKGRMVIYGSRDTIFYDGPNIYETIPIEPNIPELILDSGVGYAQLTNMLGAQEMYDNNMSAIATNQGQFAVQNVTIARGSDVNVNELDGMKFISYTPMDAPGGGKPEPLNLTQTNPEVFKYTDKLEAVLQDLSMLNGAITGNLPAGVTSGTAIATLSANSIEFITGISKAYNLCWEKTMMHAVNAYQKFAKIPQTVTFEEKSGQTRIVEFTGDQLGNVVDVKLEMINPVMRTFAGRLEVAEKLLTVPKEAWHDYVGIIEGRPPSSVYKGELGTIDLISQENEALEKGVQPPVLATDDHVVHIARHADILSNIENRINNPECMQMTLAHIEEHYKQIRGADPILLQIIKTGILPEGGIPPSSQPNPNTSPNNAKPIDAPGGETIDTPQTVGNVMADVAQPTQDLLGRG